MKNKTKTIKCVFLLFGFIMSSTVVYGQDDRLIFPKQIPNMMERANDILRKSEGFISVDFVGINLENIFNSEQFTLQFGGKSISITKERVEKGTFNSDFFVGSNSRGDRILMTVLDGNVEGIIETADVFFSIVTTKGNGYAVIKVEQSKLKKKDCGNEHGNFSPSNIPVGSNYEPNGKMDSIALLSTLDSRATYRCKKRVLVLYTSSAQASVIGDIKNTVLQAVNVTNQSSINSFIGFEIELAYIGWTNYTESGNYNTDLYRFRASGDGYMDEVHTLRNKYSADICILLTYDPSVCGAAHLNVNADEAFCMVSADCAVSNYSFAHEIGHLLGCMHEPCALNYNTSNSPYSFGHGYNSGVGWRTIMATPTGGCGGGIRIGYWSNTIISYNGLPMGTVSTHDNALVWLERSPQIMAFRQPENNVTVTSSDITNSSYGDIIAKQNTTTSGTINIASGNEMRMRAGNSITIQPGFTVQPGAFFSASIEDVRDCVPRPSPLAEMNIDEMSDINAEFFDSAPYVVESYGLSSPSAFTAGPNPVSKSSDVGLAFFWRGRAVTGGKLSVYNSFGKFIKKIKIPATTPVDLSANHLIGSWDLTDAKGRLVSEGSYLVKGVINTSGKRAKVSVVVGIR
jgi:hypothetical protein